MNKKGQGISTYIIGLLFAIGVVIGLSFFHIEIADTYGVDINPNHTEIYADIELELDSVKGFVNTTQTKTEGGIIEEFKTATLPVRAVFESIFLTFNIIPITMRLVSAIARELRLPLWFLTVIITSISVFFLYKVVSAIRGKDT